MVFCRKLDCTMKMSDIDAYELPECRRMNKMFNLSAFVIFCFEDPIR